MTLLLPKPIQLQIVPSQAPLPGPPAPEPPGPLPDPHQAQAPAEAAGPLLSGRVQPEAQVPHGAGRHRAVPGQRDVRCEVLQPSPDSRLHLHLAEGDRRGRDSNQREPGPRRHPGEKLVLFVST